MTNPDTLSPLEGEAQIPPLAPRRRGANNKAILAGGILLLSLVAVLGLVATRYFAKQEPEPEAIRDVASATALRLKFGDPEATRPARPASAPSAMASAPPIVATVNRVPSIEGGAQAIPVRAAAGAGARGQPQARVVPPGDESPFTTGAPRADVAAPSTARPGSPAANAQANLADYEKQLGGMMGQLQNLTNKATEPKAAAPAFATAAQQLAAATQPGNPVLFGSMERSATPTVVAGQLGDRSLTMPKGVLFTCGLKTRVITATSGFVGCQVQRNVFSNDGRVVLAERGSHLDGEYRIVQVRPGLTRIPVLWTRLRTPHGVTVDLDSPATGALGESGIGGHVDNRWVERIGAALMLSLIDDAVKIVATDNNSTSGSSTVVLPSTTAAGSKLAEKVLESTINIPPLLYQNQGSVVGVYVARDVDFSKVYALEPR